MDTAILRALAILAGIRYTKLPPNACAAQADGTTGDFLQRPPSHEPVHHHHRVFQLGVETRRRARFRTHTVGFWHYHHYRLAAPLMTRYLRPHFSDPDRTTSFKGRSIGQGDTHATCRCVDGDMVAQATANNGKPMQPTLVDRARRRFSPLQTAADHWRPRVRSKAIPQTSSPRWLESVVSEANPGWPSTASR